MMVGITHYCKFANNRRQVEDHGIHQCHCEFMLLSSNHMYDYMNGLDMNRMTSLVLED